MDRIMESSPAVQFCVWESIFVGFVGSLTSFLLALTIYRRNVWNQFNLFVYYMSICDFLFYLTYFNHVNYDLNISEAEYGHNKLIWIDICQILESIFGNLSYSISSIMYFTVTWLLVKGRIFDIANWKFAFAFFIILPQITWLPLAILSISSRTINNQMFYLSFTLFLISQVVLSCINIVYYLINVYTLKKRDVRNINLSDIQKAIVKLVSRLKWYPLLQVITRFFPTWMALRFPDYLFRKKSFEASNSYYMAIYCLHDLSLLITPVGFLLLYLRMKPEIKLRAMLFCCCTNDQLPLQSQITRSTTIVKSEAEQEANDRTSGNSHTTDYTAKSHNYGSSIVSSNKNYKFDEIDADETLDDEELFDIIDLTIKLSMHYPESSAIESSLKYTPSDSAPALNNPILTYRSSSDL